MKKEHNIDELLDQIKEQKIVIRNLNEKLSVQQEESRKSRINSRIYAYLATKPLNAPDDSTRSLQIQKVVEDIHEAAHLVETAGGIKVRNKLSIHRDYYNLDTNRPHTLESIIDYYAYPFTRPADNYQTEPSERPTLTEGARGYTIPKNIADKLEELPKHMQKAMKSNYAIFAK